MSRLNLKFYIENAEISVNEMGNYIAGKMRFPSERYQEMFAKEASWWIMQCVAGKVEVTKAQSERSRIRKLWVKLHPPNFDGYYYCHIGGEWVHESMAELDHIIASSIERINTDEPDWDAKLRMSCSQHNYLKSSSKVISKTLIIAPPDEAS